MPPDTSLLYFAPISASLPEGVLPPSRFTPFTGLPLPAHPFSLRPHSSVRQQYRNVNLLSIAYAFRPQLRSRLPQGRSALPWNPQVFGLGDSHTHLATHSGILPSWNSTAPFGAASPLHQCSPTSRSLWIYSMASVSCFSPVHFRRGTSRLVSYYALFE